VQAAPRSDFRQNETTPAAPATPHPGSPRNPGDPARSPSLPKGHLLRRPKRRHPPNAQKMIAYPPVKVRRHSGNSGASPAGNSRRNWGNELRRRYSQKTSSIRDQCTPWVETRAAGSTPSPRTACSHIASGGTPATTSDAPGTTNHEPAASSPSSCPAPQPA